MNKEEPEYTFKTSPYQRRANLKYMEKIKEDPERHAAFIKDRRQFQNNYYQKNKEKILAKMKERRDRLKKEQSLKN
jgi:hypothetical protein